MNNENVKESPSVGKKVKFLSDGIEGVIVNVEENSLFPFEIEYTDDDKFLHTRWSKESDFVLLDLSEQMEIDFDNYKESPSVGRNVKMLAGNATGIIIDIDTKSSSFPFKIKHHVYDEFKDDFLVTGWYKESDFVLLDLSEQMEIDFDTYKEYTFLHYEKLIQEVWYPLENNSELEWIFKRYPKCIRRKEIKYDTLEFKIKKPDWKDSPDWAKYLTFDTVQMWMWHQSKPLLDRGLWFSGGQRLPISNTEKVTYYEER